MNTYVKSLFTVATGSALSKLLNVIFALIVARLYLPGAVGELSIVLATASILTMVITCRYELSIIDALDKEACFSYGISTLFLAVVLFFFLFLISCFIKCLDVFNWGSSLWMALALVFFRLAQNFCIFNKNFVLLSFATALIALFVGVSKTFSGFFAFSELAVVHVSAYFLSSVVFLIFVCLKCGLLLKDFSINRTLDFLVEKIRFPKGQLPADLLNAFSLHMPVFFISYLYGQFELGLYAFAFSIVSAPVAFIVSSISGVFRKRLSELLSAKGDVINFLRINAVYLSLASLCVFLLLALASPLFEKYWLGEKWLGVGEILLWMCILGCFQLPAKTLSFVYVSLGCQYRNLKLQLLYVFIVLTVFALSFVFKFEFVFFVKAYSLVVGCFYCFVGVDAFVVAKRKLH